MTRDLDRLAGGPFDLLVIGGGIAGLAIAYDAAQRGLRTALVECEDFGSGASFNHQRTVHGGLRSLQRLDLRRARESACERAAFARIAPHMVRPVPFAIPLVGGTAAGRLAVGAGLLLHRLVSLGCSRDVPPALRLPAGGLIPRAEAASRFPLIRRPDMTGAGLWYDYVTVESDRLTFAFAEAAAAHGAVLVNHAEALSITAARGRARGARIRDTLSGQVLDVTARLTINATTGAADRLLLPLGLRLGMPLLKAMNLVLRRPAGEAALGSRSPSGRHLMLVPWRGRLVAGTWESPRPVDSTLVVAASEAEVAAFIDELNRTFPTLGLQRDEVTLVHRGLVPAVRGRDGRLRLAREARIRDHAADGVDRLISVAIVKYTTARAVAAQVVDRAQATLGLKATPSRTNRTPLPGCIADAAQAVARLRQDHAARLSSATLEHLVAAYGTRAPEVLALALERPEWEAPLWDESPVIGAQLVRAVRDEMAATLADAVIRRTPLGALGCPPDAALERAAALVGRELHWSDERRRCEIDEVRRFYAVYGSLKALNT